MKTTLITLVIDHHEDIPPEKVVDRLYEILPSSFSIGTSIAVLQEVEVS